MNLVVLARKMMLTPAQAVALPAAIDSAAGKVGFTREAMIAEAFSNPALCEYIASVIRSVMK